MSKKVIKFLILVLGSVSYTTFSIHFLGLPFAAQSVSCLVFGIVLGVGLSLL